MSPRTRRASLPAPAAPASAAARYDGALMSKPADPLTGKELEGRLASLPGWTVDAGGLAISKLFSFGSFADAFAFMTRVAAKAEAMDHHPEWSNVYNRVDVRLTTHSAGGVTEADLELGAFMDEAAAASS